MNVSRFNCISRNIHRLPWNLLVLKYPHPPKTHNSFHLYSYCLWQWKISATCSFSFFESCYGIYWWFFFGSCNQMFIKCEEIYFGSFYPVSYKLPLVINSLCLLEASTCERRSILEASNIIEPISYKLPQIIGNHNGLHLLCPCIISLSIEGWWLLPYLSCISCHVKYPKEKNALTHCGCGASKLWYHVRNINSI